MKNRFIEFASFNALISTLFVIVGRFGLLIFSSYIFSSRLSGGSIIGLKYSKNEMESFIQASQSIITWYYELVMNM